ncbi:rab GTPase-activating protein 22-like isoform X1 [Salvia splendens]|uniref:rab GTPase-activating protein 22-like isoform X1 n=1 Tax=Salvia splendens TaxID=180675 RepID=UPI001C25D131|nr:rab GTPase-activating protein 22-like isoform X1 [Salvia splendens]
MVENQQGVSHLPRGRFVIPRIHPMLAGGAAAVQAIGSRIGDLSSVVFIGGGGGGGFWRDAASNGGLTLAFTAFAGLALAAAVFYTSRGRLKSPWSRRKRKHILSPQQWKSLFTPDGKLRDNGVKFLKKVRSGGVDPSIRGEVWPFLLGVYDLRSTKEERDTTKVQNRKEYEKLRRQCRQLLKHISEPCKLNANGETSNAGGGSITEEVDSPCSEEVVSARESLSSEEAFDNNEEECHTTSSIMNEYEGSKRITDSNVTSDSESSESESSDDPELSQTFDVTESTQDQDPENDLSSKEDSSPSSTDVQSQPFSRENFATWQRIIRLDAIRANEDWISYSPSQATVTDAKAHRAAEAARLKDYEHLIPSRIFHAARLVAILEAYAMYDPEIGYCQGMSDLLSPIIAVVTEDHEAFWCFVGFMKKARHNFRLDEVGIRRQLNIVSKIIKYKDSHLYRHLEELQAEDCFFVYRMVVVLFRRELTFDQTLCLWEVVWADQAAIRAGIGKSAWSRIRQRAPPTDDLLLYAIAASVLQRRKQIVEKYNSMDEILRECNSMAGHLDVWKLLDDAHHLVVNLHDKIETC